MKGVRLEVGMSNNHRFKKNQKSKLLGLYFLLSGTGVMLIYSPVLDNKNTDLVI